MRINVLAGKYPKIILLLLRPKHSIQVKMCYMPVWDLCLCVSDYHGRRACTAILTFGCLLPSSSFCSRTAQFSAAVPGEGTVLLGFGSGFGRFKGFGVSVVRSFKSMFSDSAPNFGCGTVCCLFHWSHCQSSHWFQRKYSVQTTFPMGVLCVTRQFLNSCNPGSLWHTYISLHYLRICLFPDTLANPSQCGILCYKYIIQPGLNEGMSVPTTL